MSVKDGIPPRILSLRILKKFSIKKSLFLNKTLNFKFKAGSFCKKLFLRRHKDILNNGECAEVEVFTVHSPLHSPLVYMNLA